MRDSEIYCNRHKCILYNIPIGIKKKISWPRIDALEGKEKDLRFCLTVTERESGNREPIQPRVLIDKELGRLIGRTESHRGKNFLELKKKANFWSRKKKEVQGDANSSSETSSDIVSGSKKGKTYA